MTKPKAERHLVYSQQATDFMPGKAYANPRHFSTPRDGFAKVFIVGDEGSWPNIAEAYQAMGVAVEYVDEGDVRRAADGVAASAAPAAAMPADLKPAAEDDKARAEIPENWRELPWIARADKLSLRQVASRVSDVPVTNKAIAEEAIEAELRRRAQHALHMAGEGAQNQAGAGGEDGAA